MEYERRGGVYAVLVPVIQRYTSDTTVDAEGQETVSRVVSLRPR